MKPEEPEQSNFRTVSNFLLHSDQTEVFVFGPQLLRNRSADHMNVAVTYDLDLTFNSHKL